MGAPEHNLTLAEIQRLTGHQSTDAVRMAFRRNGIKASGVSVGLSWPPIKIYSSIDVWNLFSSRIIQNIENNAELQERCWNLFSYQIREANASASSMSLFADKME